MKKYIIFIFIIIINLLFYRNCLGCDLKLAPFKEDCELADNYNKIKKKYNQLGIDVTQILVYKASRIIPLNIIESAFYGNRFRPWQIYGTESWVEWESGNFFSNQLKSELEIREENEGSWRLTVDDLKELHQSILNPKLLGKAQHLIYDSTLYKSAFPEIGKFRSKGNINSGFSISPSNENKYFYLNHDIKDSNGKPMLTYKVIVPALQARVTYLRSSLTETAMAALLTEINSTINNYSHDPKSIQSSATHKTTTLLPESPFEFAARMQRNYIAIHPFHEGNGRISRLIQDIILEKFGLPPVPGGYLQDDVSVPLEDYLAKSRESTKKILEKLENCLNDFSNSNPTRSECQPTYHNLRHSTYGSDSEMEEQYEKENLRDQLRKSIIKNTFNKKCDSSSFFETFERISDFFDITKNTIHPLNKNPSLVIDASSHPSVYEYLSDDRKRQLLENIAEIIPEDIETYHWTHSQSALQRRKILLKSNSIFRAYLGKTSKTSVDLKLGAGLYVSDNIFDSLEFALPFATRKEITSRLERLDLQALESLLNSSQIKNKASQLLKITVKKGQRRINLTQRKTLAAAYKVLHQGHSIHENGTQQDLSKIRAEIAREVGRLNPDAMITYAGKTKNWSVLKFRNLTTAIESSVMTPRNVDPKTVIKINDVLSSNPILGSDSSNRSEKLRYVSNWLTRNLTFMKEVILINQALVTQNQIDRTNCLMRWKKLIQQAQEASKSKEAFLLLAASKIYAYLDPITESCFSGALSQDNKGVTLFNVDCPRDRTLIATCERLNVPVD